MSRYDVKYSFFLNKILTDLGNVLTQELVFG